MSVLPWIRILLKKNYKCWPKLIFQSRILIQLWIVNYRVILLQNAFCTQKKNVLLWEWIYINIYKTGLHDKIIILTFQKRKKLRFWIKKTVLFGFMMLELLSVVQISSIQFNVLGISVTWIHDFRIRIGQILDAHIFVWNSVIWVCYIFRFWVAS